MPSFAAPVTVISAVPGVAPRPVSRYQPGPRRAISAAAARLSTFWTSVGRPPIPRSKGRGGVVVGRASPSLTKWTAADSSPATYVAGRVDDSERQPDVGPLGDRAAEREAGVAVLGSDVELDPVGADGVGGDQRPVEDEMRPKAEQRPVLRAERLALGAVDEDDRSSAGPGGLLGDRSPLAPDREAGPAAAEQPACLEGRDRVPGRRAVRPPAEAGAMVAERFGPGRGRWAGEQAQVHVSRSARPARPGSGRRCRPRPPAAGCGSSGRPRVGRTARRRRRRRTVP